MPRRSVTRSSATRNTAWRPATHARMTRTGRFPSGVERKLHLLARRLVLPHPRGGTIDVTAPLPPHMHASWELFGFDARQFDPIEDAPEE